MELLRILLDCFLEPSGDWDWVRGLPLVIGAVAAASVMIAAVMFLVIRVW